MKYLGDLIGLFFPRTCCICGNPLVGDEREVCATCLLDLPETLSALGDDNFVEHRLAGRIPLMNATALLIFRQGNSTQRVLHDIKYRGNRRLGLFMGHQLGLRIAQTGRFGDVDIIVPVPLHSHKERSRGYNQSLLLCRGIAETLHRPVVDRCLVRTRHTESQTKKSRAERLSNMSGVFAVTDPSPFEHKHILLVDDVITTGATIEACCQPLIAIKGVKISIAALAVSGDT